jgi:hypothetical protein
VETVENDPETLNLHCFGTLDSLWKNCGKLGEFSTGYLYLLITWGTFPQVFHRNLDFSTGFPQGDCQGILTG